MDPDNSKDIDKFKRIIEKNNKCWEIEVREEPNPFLARIIIAGDWIGKPEEVKELLEDIYEKWPKGKKVKFIITCGGFIQFEWPKSLSKESIGNPKNPNNKVVDLLVSEAEKCVKSILTEDIGNKLREVTDYITLGVDSYKEKISTTQNYINQPHIELVFLVDLRNNKFYWTGKSYPTPNQQNGLVRIANLKTHFFNLDIGKVMILGCHDLTIFNPRSKNAKEWRKDVNEKFKKIAKEEKSKIVLQHPHTTVKIRTWLNAWGCLKKMLPSVEKYASAGRYYESDRNPLDYDGINDVLACTKDGDAIDFIVYLGGNK